MAILIPPLGEMVEPSTPKFFLTNGIAHSRIVRRQIRSFRQITRDLPWKPL
jgi:hypothetical protein